MLDDYSNLSVAELNQRLSKIHSCINIEANKEQINLDNLETLQYYKELIVEELKMRNLKKDTPAAINLTVDPLSEAENAAKNKK